MMRGPAVAVAIAVGVGLAASSAPAEVRGDLGACSPDAVLNGFTDALDKTTFAGTAVGGLSALALRGHDAARVLVDNQGTTNARFYDLDLAIARACGR